LQVGCYQAEQGGAKEHTGNHFADHLWLMEVFFPQPANRAAGGKDNEHLDEKEH
jgi:hypothetical protein